MGRGPRNPGCTCCDDDCHKYQDSFDRSDDTDLGADWTEEAGDWSISSNEVTVASTGALLICDAQTVSGDQALWCYLSADTVGDKLRFILAYTDSSNYIAVEVTAGDPFDEIKCFTVISGSEVQRGDTQYGYYTGAGDGTDRQIFICCDLTNDLVHANEFGQQLENARIGGCVFELPSSHPTGNKLGLGTGDTLTGTVTFAGGSDLSASTPITNGGFNIGSLQDEYSSEKGCLDCLKCIIYQEPSVSIDSNDWQSAPSEASKTNGLEVVSGTSTDWSVVGGDLRYAPASADDSTVLTRFPNQYDETESRVTLGYDLNEAAYNDSEVRVIVNAVDDSNYLYCDLINDSSGNTRVALGKRTSGTDSDSITSTKWQVVQQGSVQLCYANGILAVRNTANVEQYLQTEITPHATGYKTGFRCLTASASKTIDITRFEWRYHEINRSGCGRCCGVSGVPSTHCSDGVPEFMHIAFNDTSFDGTYVLDNIGEFLGWRYSVDGLLITVNGQADGHLFAHVGFPHNQRFRTINPGPFNCLTDTILMREYNDPAFGGWGDGTANVSAIGVCGSH